MAEIDTDGDERISWDEFWRPLLERHACLHRAIVPLSFEVPSSRHFSHPTSSISIQFLHCFHHLDVRFVTKGDVTVQHANTAPEQKLVKFGAYVLVMVQVHMAHGYEAVTCGG